MSVTGPDFISLQVRELEQSAAFYQRYLGLERAPVAPPHAVVFATRPVAFAVRDIAPGVDLSTTSQPGLGVGIWLLATEVQSIHDALAADGMTIVTPPFDGPFGRTFTFADLDGYHVTLHDRG